MTALRIVDRKTYVTVARGARMDGAFDQVVDSGTKTLTRTVKDGELVALSVRVAGRAPRCLALGPVDRQARAVYREWQAAIEDGALELAARIEVANPDLFEVGA